MASTSTFSISLTFPNISGLRVTETERHEKQNLVESSLLNARPTALQSWSNPDHTEDSPVAFVALGCEDGTLYVFNQSCQSTNTVDLRFSVPTQPSPSTKTPRSAKRRSYATSRSSSPTTPISRSATPFGFNSRSRVVSGITTEAVEAPKNYVDFDDEPEKLKDMLKGRKSKEKPAGGDHINTSLSISSPQESGSKLKHSCGPLSTAIHTSKPNSTPESPRDQVSFGKAPSHDLGLLYHVILPTSGFDKAVKCIQSLHLNHHQYLAVLQATGDLHLLASDDGSCLASVHVGDALTNVSNLHNAPLSPWAWCTLHTLQIEESTILLVSATNMTASLSLASTESEEASAGRTRSVLFELVLGNPLDSHDVKLVLLNEWGLEGSPTGVGVYQEPDKTYSVYSLGSEGNFLVRRLQPRPPAPAYVSAPGSDSHLNYATLPIPNPFKSMMSQSSNHLPLVEDKKDTSRMTLSETFEAGKLPLGSALLGLRTRRHDNKLLGVAWTHHEVINFEYQERLLNVLSHAPISAVKAAEWLDDDSFALSFEDRVDIMKLKLVNADNDDADINTIKSGLARIHPQVLRSINIGPHEAHDFSSPSQLVISRMNDNKRQLISFLIGVDDSDEASSRTLWHPSNQDSSTPQVTLTSMLPLELDVIIHGYSDGHIRQFSLAQMCTKPEKSPLLDSLSIKTSDAPLGGYITGLHMVQNPRTREKFIAGGADDGSVAFWSYNTFVLCARWIVFITPLASVLQFRQEITGPLQGCVLCISCDGTVAIIAVDGFQFLYLVPGSASLLKRVCLGSDNLLLIYADRHARLWDVKTREFWRSMGLDKAEELLAQGGWTDLSVEVDACLSKTLWKPIRSSFNGRDAVSTFSLDLERFIVESMTVTKSISTSRDQTRVILQTLDKLRLMLSTVLTPGLNVDVDSICYRNLGITVSSAFPGWSSGTSVTLFNEHCPQDPWCISGTQTAAHALAVIVLLRALGLFEEFLEGANTVISFYATSIGPCVGVLYQPPDLAFLARQWFDASNELRQAIRILFDATVARMSDEEATRTAEQWQHHVPFLQPAAERETINTALALFICGYVAAEKYSLLTTNALTDISKSISLYLHDEKSAYRVLAIDLCSRGFHVWQHYIDAIEILRSLFNLATNTRKDAISTQNVAVQARAAVLSIAANNTPLFITTLCLDILTPLTLEHRRSVMQIVAYLIRKRPLVLQPNLPKLMEAVVKSLDPNATANREAVLDTATEIIGFVVKTFPTVDFHMATQRLAVGSNEGAVVMYDLKTAIRLYVLEGHKKEITACSFSPDGRRLVTLSMDESVVLVWKVGSSLTSFFNPGAPPRQGHGGSLPYKTLNFNIGSSGTMSVPETYEKIRFEWIADRSARLNISESVLTFST